jgi:hypothetical protein
MKAFGGYDRNWIDKLIWPRFRGFLKIGILAKVKDHGVRQKI